MKEPTEAQWMAALGAKECMPAKRGPKPLHGENMQAYHFRMTKAQREKLELLGGAAWLRDKIKRAALYPTPSKDE
jgi:hypothetical protein